MPDPLIFAAGQLVVVINGCPEKPLLFVYCCCADQSRFVVVVPWHSSSFVAVHSPIVWLVNNGCCCNPDFLPFFFRFEPVTVINLIYIKAVRIWRAIALFWVSNWVTKSLRSYSGRRGFAILQFFEACYHALILLGDPTNGTTHHWRDTSKYLNITK